jgi:hypothetical protein
MGTVTGLTAERILEILDGTVESAAVVGGHLILTLHDATEIDAGSVIGPTGATGATGATGPTFNGGTVTNDIVVDKGTAVVRLGGSAAQGWVTLEKEGSSSPGDSIGVLAFYGENSASTRKLYGYVEVAAVDNTNGSEDGRYTFNTQRGGVDTESFKVESGRPYLSQNELLNSDGTRKVIWGAGPPEGVATSSIGGFYLDTTNGYSYEKRTGTGNTGWVRVSSNFGRARGTRITSDLSIANASSTFVDFNGESFDTGTIHDTGTNPHRFVAPTGATYVRMDGQVTWAGAGANTTRQLDIYTDAAVYASLVDYTTHAQQFSQPFNILMPITAGNWCAVAGYQNTGSALNVKLGATLTFCTVEFS